MSHTRPKQDVQYPVRGSAYLLADSFKVDAGTACKISRKYEIEEGIESLLKHFNAKDLFSHVEGNPDDVIENPNETKDYKITIDYKKRPQRVIEGSYDKKGLPESE